MAGPLRRGPGDEHIDLVRAYIETEPYLKVIRKRKVWIEPLFAEGKLWHRMRRFRTRTLEKTNTEALLIAAGQNVKRLLTFGGGRPKKVGAGCGRRAAAQTAARPSPPQIRRTSPKTGRPTRSFSTSWTVYRTSVLAPLKATFKSAYLMTFKESCDVPGIT